MTENGITYIFRPYITIKGKRIYRKNGGMFKIPISNEKATGLGNTVAQSSIEFLIGYLVAY